MKAAGQFGRIPSAVVDRGDLRGISGPAAKVIIALCRHNDARFVSFPGVDLIASEMGLDERAVRRALDELVERGIIKRERGGGRGRSNRYKFLNTGCNAPLSGDAKIEETLVAGDPKGGQISTKTRVTIGRNPGCIAPRTDLTGGTDQQQGCGHKAATAAAESSAVIALKNAGISEPTRSLLANTPGITAELIEEVDRSAKRRGKGTGIVVNEIREELERRRVEEESLARSQEYAAQEAERRQRQAAADKRIADEAEAWINKIEPSAIVAMFAELAAARDPSIPPVFWKNPPRDAQAIAKTYATPLFRRYGLGTPQGP